MKIEGGFEEGENCQEFRHLAPARQVDLIIRDAWFVVRPCGYAGASAICPCAESRTSAAWCTLYLPRTHWTLSLTTSAPQRVDVQLNCILTFNVPFEVLKSSILQVEPTSTNTDRRTPPLTDYSLALQRDHILFPTK